MLFVLRSYLEHTIYGDRGSILVLKERRQGERGKRNRLFVAPRSLAVSYFTFVSYTMHNEPFKDEAVRTALFKDPVRTAQ